MKQELPFNPRAQWHMLGLFFAAAVLVYLVWGLLNHLLPLLAEFETTGFGPWRDRWLLRNAHATQSDYW